MGLRTVAIILLLLSAPISVLGNSTVELCDERSGENCNHYESINSTDVVSLEFGNPDNLEISADGEHILFESFSNTKYYLYNVDKQKVIESDFLFPGEHIGYDWKNGYLLISDSETCRYVVMKSIDCFNPDLESPSYDHSIGNYLGAYHSPDYLVCDIDPGWLASTPCEAYENSGRKFIPIRQHTQSALISPDGRYEAWSEQYVEDREHGDDDVGLVISTGKRISWEIEFDNRTQEKSTITRVIYGYLMSNEDEDDLYGRVWSQDSEYLYLISCKEIRGINVVESYSEVLADNPIECDRDFLDEVDDDKVENLNNIEHMKFSNDGATLVYVQDGEIVVLKLGESSIVIEIIVSIIFVAICAAAYYVHKKRRGANETQ